MHKTKIILLAFLLTLVGMFSPQNVQGQLISSNRIADWTPYKYIGPTNGPVIRTTVYTNLPAGLVDTNINQALAACPADQVVQLTNGYYFLYKVPIQNLLSRRTLRGKGPGKTIIVAMITNSFGGAVMTDQVSEGSTFTNIVAGFDRGSTNVILSSTVPSITVGGLIKFTQMNNSNVWSRDFFERQMRHYAVITALSGTGNTNVKFFPPIPWDTDTNLAPALAVSSQVMDYGLGFEDFTLVMSSTNVTSYGIWLSGVHNSWMHNIEITNCPNAAYLVSQTVGCEAWRLTLRGTQTANDGFGEWDRNSNFYIHDCISEGLFAGIMVNSGDMFVVAYNFITNGTSSVFTRQLGALNGNHGPHNIMGLYEGNVSEQFQVDGYHGSASHQTIFGNRFHGLHGKGTTNALYKTNRKMIDLARRSLYHNVLGNYLGDSSWTPDFYSVTNLGYSYNLSTIYRFGYPNMGDNNYVVGQSYTNIANPGYDGEVTNTIYLHRNYDTFTGGVVNDGVSQTNLPNSYFLTNAPSYWTNVPSWPPFVVGTAANWQYGTNTIPAQDRYRLLALGDTPTIPVISSVTASSVTATTATITWTTDSASDSMVTYNGISTTVDPTLVTSHSVNLSGLTAATLYSYTVTSANVAGSTTSSTFLFTTAYPYPNAIIPARLFGGILPPEYFDKRHN